MRRSSIIVPIVSVSLGIVSLAATSGSARAADTAGYQIPPTSTTSTTVPDRCPPPASTVGLPPQDCPPPPPPRDPCVEQGSRRAITVPEGRPDRCPPPRRDPCDEQVPQTRNGTLRTAIDRPTGDLTSDPCPPPRRGPDPDPDPEHPKAVLHYTG
jgi:hypothetical protein